MRSLPVQILPNVNAILLLFACKQAKKVEKIIGNATLSLSLEFVG